MPFSRKDSALPGPIQDKKRRKLKLIVGFLLLLVAAFAAGQTLPASAQSAPTVTRVSPSSGPLVGGQTVVITGTNLTGASAVNFGASGTPATSFAVMSDKQIVAVVPNATAAGKVLIEVTTSGGTNTTGASYDYLAPKITKVDPGHATESTSSFVTITGEGLLGAATTDVTIGGNDVVNVWVVSDKQIVVETPIDDDNGTSGDTSDDIVVDNGVADVVITRSGVATTPDDKSKFLFTPGLPTVTQLEDGSSNVVTGTDGVAAGQDLTIVGTQLWGLSEVKFGTSRVTTGITVNTAGTNATLTVPTRSAGPVDIVVTNAAGTSLTNLNTTFSYYSTTAPSITSVYPSALDNAASGGGGTVLVTGRGLTGVGTGQVTLTCSAGTPTASSATSISDTSLILVLSGNADTDATCDLKIDNPTDNTLTVTKTGAIRYL